MHSDHTAIEKKCCTCGETKPIAEFAMKITSTGQRQSRCRGCQKLASRAHYESNKEAVIARSAERTAAQRTVLQAEVRKKLKGAACACCGAKRKLTFKVKPDYTGPRVSAVVHNGMALATLEDAIANSTIVCEACMWQSFVPALDKYQEERKAGTHVPKKIPACEYKRRHTLSAADQRVQRHERSPLATPA